LAKPHAAVKEAVLRGGVEAFAQGKPIAGIKVLVTEIEGILNVAYRAPTGEAGNTEALLGFAIESAENELMARYPVPNDRIQPLLAELHVCQLNRDNLTEGAVSLYLVGHGDTGVRSSTMVRALPVTLR